MTRRDHAVLTALAASGALLTLFQNWYISLPLEEASRIDLCRLTPAINCFKSLYAHGPEMLAFGLPVFPALLAIFVFQTALCGFAWVAAAARADAWLSLARLASFPASGLAIFVLLNDMMVAKATSVSAILVAGASLAISVLTVVHGLGKLRLRNAGRASVGLLLAALLAGFFVLTRSTFALNADMGLLTAFTIAFALLADFLLLPPLLMRLDSQAVSVPSSTPTPVGAPHEEPSIP